ncbi:MAG: helix-turn-helix transcriptional regulator [Acidimicrobiia bacterium]
MKEYEFTLIVAGDLDSDEVVNALYEAGCDDASFGEVNGVGVGDFTREANSILDAVASAISQVESVGGLRVRRVEPEPLVTIPEIAERLGRTPESIRLLANGERGGGTFPPPVSHLRTRQRLWRWADVAEWAGELKPAEVEDARVLAAFNVGLEYRHLAGALDIEVLQLIGESLGTGDAA